MPPPSSAEALKLLEMLLGMLEFHLFHESMKVRKDVPLMDG